MKFVIKAQMKFMIELYNILNLATQLQKQIEIFSLGNKIVEDILSWYTKYPAFAVDFEVMANLCAFSLA